MINTHCGDGVYSVTLTLYYHAWGLLMPIDRQSVESEPSVPLWVGHRGYPEAFPENSVKGIRAALAAGASAIEFDIQASRDGEPVVIHDPKLRRVCGISGRVQDYDLSQLCKISAHEPGRFGRRFDPTLIPSLDQMVAELTNWPKATFFVEVKEEVFDRFNRSDFMLKLWGILAPVREQTVIISFDLELVRTAQNISGCRVGWVLRHYRESVLRILNDAPVDFLISNVRRLPTGKPFWQGPWQWFVYDIVDAATAQRCLRQGARWIETWDVEKMIKLGSL